MIAGTVNLKAGPKIATRGRQFLGDLYPPKFCYSFRKLVSDYNGPCCQVRVEGSSTLYDIYFNENTGLPDFNNVLNSFTDQRAYQLRIKTWYNQLGDGKNFTQPTESLMPYIAHFLNDNSTTYPQKDISYFGIYNTPTESYHLTVPSDKSSFNFLHNGIKPALISTVIEQGSPYAVNKNLNPDSAGIILDNGGAASANVGYSLFFDDRASQSRNNAIVNFTARGVGGQFTTSTSDNNVITPHERYSILNYIDLSKTGSERTKIIVNNNEYSTNVINNPPSLSNATADMHILKYFATTTLNFRGTIREVIMWDYDLKDQLNEIKENVLKYYNIN
jgi:hypothetical protein